MIAFLKAAGMWILKLFLSGIGVKIRTDEQARLEKERDAALAREQAAKQDADLQKEIQTAQKDAADKAKADAAARPPEDPFGAGNWNAPATDKDAKK